jgi:hypothetical protein
MSRKQATDTNHNSYESMLLIDDSGKDPQELLRVLELLMQANRDLSDNFIAVKKV